jgi:hypothetical protein
MCLKPACVLTFLLSISSLGVNAGLDDKFVFSSKFGLLTESVTSSWTAEDSGLVFGGTLNGVPRDSWHDLYFYNGKLALVAMGYEMDPMNFETDIAYRKWIADAVQLLKDAASKRYGPPVSDSINCDENQPIQCSGQAVWAGSSKVFEINLNTISLDDWLVQYYGVAKLVQLSFNYGAAEDYQLLRQRLPHLIEKRNARFHRRLKSTLAEGLKWELARLGLTIEQYLKRLLSNRARMNEILRKTSINYVGGVKANYEPKRWVNSFRLQ